MSAGLLPGETTEGLHAEALETSPKARELIEAYQRNPPEGERAKAQAEAEIWQAVRYESRKKITRADSYNAKFLCRALGMGQTSDYIARGRTLGWEALGVDASAVWHTLTSGKKSSWVVKALTFAGKAYTDIEDNLMGRVDDDTLRTQASRKFEEAFLEFQTDGIQEEERRKAREATQARTQKKRGPHAPKRIVITPPAPKKDKGLDEILVDGDVQTSKDIWEEAEALLKEKINPFVKARLEGLESENGVGEILDNFYIDLRSSYQDLLLKIRRVRNLTGSKQVLEVKRESIRWALEVLRVPIKRGWSKDDLDVDSIKKQYKQLVNRFHPDKPTSDENTLARFNEVKKAYETLQESGLNI